MAAGGKRVSCGLEFTCPADLTSALQIATESKYISLIDFNKLIYYLIICQSLHIDDREST